MSEFLHFTGMAQAIPNAESKEIRFSLSVSDGSTIMCRDGVTADSF
jgi:hypothetical protein